MTTMKVFVVLMLVTAALAQQVPAISFIECPIPGQPEVVTEEECRQYTACSYTGGSCHMSREAGYIVASEPVATANGFTVELTETNPNVTLFGADIPNLVLEVIYHEDYHVQIKIRDADNVRYEVPYPINTPDEAGTDPLYTVSVSDVGKNFLLNVTRISTGTNIFRMRGPMSFENQFLQLTTELPSDYLYGIGEQYSTSLKHPFGIRKTYPIFARDQILTQSEQNEYGSHPYYVNVEDDAGNTHSMLLYSSNALEYSTFTIVEEEDTPALTMRSIGGIFDLHFFLGPTPEDVNIQYADAVGHSVFPQYWNFGFQLSRYGYNTSANYREVRDRMRSAGIPQDVQVFDIDYMDSWRDFTYSQENWGDLPELIAELHEQGLKIVLIFDPALATDWEYGPSARGRDADVFIKWKDPTLIPEDQPAGAGDYVVGYVWPENKTVFPDFMNPATTGWWVNEMELFHQELDFDGIWIDMNEPANFGTDMSRPFNYPEDQEDWSLKCPDNDLDSPPYPTRAATGPLSESGRLSDKTICMSSVQSDGISSYYHYDVHNLYGHSEILATAAAHESLFPGQRYTVLSRSSFPGSGSLAIHWLGDNQALWQQLRQSIIGMIEFNMFAFPMVGADICGFIGEPSEELCIRWMQAGAFYPFSRNHNTLGAADQDPARPGWDLCPEISRNVLTIRYKYIPYLYALFHKAHMSGHSVIRPLFNEFPTDLSSRSIGDQFLWGDGIMIAPVMEEGAESRSIHFPKATWYDLESGVKIDASGISLQVSAPLDTIPLYARGGTVIPWQQPGLTTAVSRLNPFGLTVAIDEFTGTSSGEIFWDDGINEHLVDESYMAMISYADKTLSMTAMHDVTVAEGIMLETINFFGLASEPASIMVNGEQVTSFEYDSATQVLVLTLSLPINASMTVVFA